MNEKISVIIPVYNVEPYLERCLDSVINNTYRNLEIICVDDGSPDNCGAILDRYAQMDERFVVIHKENGGVSSARNRGMEIATGEYIAFIDPDDWVHPQYFEILMHCQQSTVSDLVICGFTKTKEMAAYRAHNLTEIVSTMLNLEGIYRNRGARSYVWGKLYRKKLVAESCFVEGVRIAEDAAFNALVFGRKEDVKACYVSLPLYFYYDRPGSLVYTLKEREKLALAKIFEQYFEETQSPRVKRILLIELLKRGLSARYGLSLRAEDCRELASSNSIIHKAVGDLWKLPNASIKEKLMYGVMGYIPWTYRLFRIIDDPTLLQMEKNLK